MLLDQIIHQKSIGIKEGNVSAEIVDISLKLGEKGIESQKLETILIDPTCVLMRIAGDNSNDTKKWTVEKLEKPFMGVPFNKGKTSIKTLLKIAWVLYTEPKFEERLKRTGTLDTEERKTRASSILWGKKKEGTKDPDSTYKSSGLALPAVGKTSKGLIILGVIKPTKSPLVDDEASLALTKELRHPSTESQGEEKLGLVSQSLHMGKGSGRNNFGTDPKESKDPSEFARVYGYDTPQNVQLLQKQFSSKLTYPVRINPTPDSSQLVFFGRTEEEHSEIQEILETLKAEKFRKNEKTEDGEGVKKKEVVTLPQIGIETVTILVICPETGQKPKEVVTNVFPKVPLHYWAQLEAHFLYLRAQNELTDFLKVVKNGPKSKPSPPSAYKLWTMVFTNLLNQERAPIRPFWNELASYYKNWGGQNLHHEGKAPKGLNGWETHRGRHWLKIVKILRRLNAIVALQKTGELKVTKSTELEEKLAMKENPPTLAAAKELGAKRAPGLWETLHPTAQTRIAKAIVASEVDEIPESERTLFTQGLITGSCLNYAAYTLNEKANRRFDVGNGRHLSQLRGAVLLNEFTRAFTLAQNFNRGKSRENQISPLPTGSLAHFQKLEPASKTNTFNNGLICGFDLPPERTEKSE